jgi:pimeloyl-ACP methyl ester carboxylesterase
MNTTKSAKNIQPFKIEIPQTTLNNLHERPERTRFPDEIEGADWDYGANLSYIKELCDYWQNNFNWRKQEAKLNRFNHFQTEIDGLKIHFIHERGEGENSIPLLLTHGFPDSFYRFYKIIALLTTEQDGFSFDVIVPSIPGYGFSERPRERGFGMKKIAAVFHKLMTETLGFEKFAAHGGDLGSTIAEQIAVDFPESSIGIHLTEVPFHHLFTVAPKDLTEAEKKHLEAGKKWQETNRGYAAIQETRPQTLAYGLNDSPAGLAAWIVDLFRSWCDCAGSGDVEKCFSKDELLTNLMIYWTTETIDSASYLYYEMMLTTAKKGTEKKIETPTAVAIFPKDIVPAPKEFAERFFNLERWTEMPRGGHFAALEEPKLLADDLREFFSGSYA